MLVVLSDVRYRNRRVRRVPRIPGNSKSLFRSCSAEPGVALNLADAVKWTPNFGSVD